MTTLAKWILMTATTAVLVGGTFYGVRVAAAMLDAGPPAGAERYWPSVAPATPALDA